MKKSYLLVISIVANTTLVFSEATSTTIPKPIPNERIDFEAFVTLAQDRVEKREQKRLTETEFIEAINSGEYILLDARSINFYKQLHIKGAVNLPLTEFSESSLAKIIPNKKSKILIYCNNNFSNRPGPFFSKGKSVSLNASTQINLAGYGYEEIYELGPYLDTEKTAIIFSGLDAKK